MSTWHFINCRVHRQFLSRISFSNSFDISIIVEQVNKGKFYSSTMKEDLWHRYLHILQWCTKQPQVVISPYYDSFWGNLHLPLFVSFYIHVQKFIFVIICMYVCVYKHIFIVTMYSLHNVKFTFFKNKWEIKLE